MTLNRMGLMAAIFALGVVAAGCAHKPKDTAGGSGVIPGSQADLAQNVGDRIFFETDKYGVDAQGKSTLQRQAAWLAKWSNVSVTVEGHCDERGTREYNLALGDRRANAARDSLVSLGVSASRIKTISYGEERPDCVESSEACWAKNRRAVTVVTGGAPNS
jgi:peptidoglycan-associated lipoprotein